MFLEIVNVVLVLAVMGFKLQSDDRTRHNYVLVEARLILVSSARTHGGPFKRIVPHIFMANTTIWQCYLVSIQHKDRPVQGLQ